MKKPVSDHAKNLRRFKALRAIAIAALICTATLTAFILIESILPGDASGKQSDMIGDAIQSVTGKGDEELDSALSAFGSFSIFVRKGLGHFSLFAVLGFGLSICTFVFLKPRSISPAISLIIGAIIAMLSEALQLPVFTSGRSARWEDVGIDALGVVCGVAFAFTLLCLFALIKKLADKNGYLQLKSILSYMRFSTIMKNSGAIAATFDEEYQRCI